MTEITNSKLKDKAVTIKTFMYMKAFFLNKGRILNTTLKTLPAALLMAGMVSCSDETTPADPNEGNNSQPDGLETSALTVFTNPANMPSRVLNYSFGKTGSRAIDPDIDLAAYLAEVEKIDLSKLPELKDINLGS